MTRCTTVQLKKSMVEAQYKKIKHDLQTLFLFSAVKEQWGLAKSLGYTS